jgi:hypothetical protein
MKSVVVKNREAVINLDQKLFSGDVLDIGAENYGVVYNLFKQYNNEVAVDYVHGEREKDLIEKGSYDKCIMLFSFNNIWPKLNRKAYVKDMYDFLKSDGEIHIWDLDKGLLKGFKINVKIIFPDGNSKEIIMKDYNILKDASLRSTTKLLENYFEIIDLKHFDNIYYIRGRKLAKVSSNKNDINYK